MKLSIVVPAYNEEKRLGRMLGEYLAYFEPRYGEDCEIVVAINGSTDGTERIARGIAAEHPAVKVVVEPAAIGKGGAVILGGKAAAGELVGFADADGSTPPEAFDSLVREIGDADFISANRWMKESLVEPRQPFKRRVSSRVFNALVRILFKVGTSDTQCGAKLMTREAWEKVMPALDITRWAFDVDLLFKARRAGVVFKEIPTVWRDRDGSKIHYFSSSMEMLLSMGRLRLVYSPFKFIVTAYDATNGFIARLRRAMKPRKKEEVRRKK
jgi:glycosyltransferase involved in cell wall biosynthesis